MDKPKPQITQVKAPSKWDILKAKTEYIKEYLKGQVLKGTLVTHKPQVTVSTTKFDDGGHLRKHRKRRKKLKKVSYTSRRRNRSRL